MNDPDLVQKEGMTSGHPFFMLRVKRLVEIVLESEEYTEAL